MAQQVRGSDVALHVAVVAIVIATVANTLVKAGMAVFLGKGLAKPVLLGTAAIFVVGAVALLVT